MPSMSPSSIACLAAEEPAPSTAAEQVAQPAHQKIQAGIAANLETAEIARLPAVGTAAVLDPVQRL